MKTIEIDGKKCEVIQDVTSEGGEVRCVMFKEIPKEPELCEMERYIEDAILADHLSSEDGVGFRAGCNWLVNRLEESFSVFREDDEFSRGACQGKRSVISEAKRLIGRG